MLVEPSRATWHAGLSYARFSTEGTMIREYAMYPHYMQPRAFRLMNEVCRAVLWQQSSLTHSLAGRRAAALHLGHIDACL